MVAVSYSGPHQDLDNTNLLKTSAGDSKQDSSKTLTKIKEVSKRFLPPSRPPARPARPTFRSYLKSEELNKEGEGEGEEEGEEEGSTHSEPSVPSSASARAHTRRGVVHEAGGNSGSGRGAELRMRRSGSDDDDDASSRASTVKPQASVPSMDFTDLLSLSSTRHQPTLTLSGLQAFTKSEAGKQKGYLPNHVPSWDKDPGERNRGERGRCVCVCVCVCVLDICFVGVCVLHEYLHCLVYAGVVSEGMILNSALILQLEGPWLTQTSS